VKKKTERARHTKIRGGGSSPLCMWSTKSHLNKQQAFFAAAVAAVENPPFWSHERRNENRDADKENDNAFHDAAGTTKHTHSTKFLVCSAIICLRALVQGSDRREGRRGRQRRKEKEEKGVEKKENHIPLLHPAGQAFHVFDYFPVVYRYSEARSE